MLETHRRAPAGPARRRGRSAPALRPDQSNDATPANETDELTAAVAAFPTHRFGEVEVPVTIARALERMGYVEPTEVQARSIPVLQAGRDLIAQAQTGTGKTAAFGIPIVQRIDPSNRRVQALVLTPTRELCVQVTDEIARLGQFRNVRPVAIYGGASMDRQIRGLADGAQVVVGTPGRVLDLIRRR
ncbi:MAG: DEAD/DEAH box helicase, partial [Chloroflexota bacterium]|nr:DEAD/DEAH box helicase [Chloroflexota bacterium]